MGEAPLAEFCFDHAVSGAHCLDDLAVPDVHADVSVPPDGKARHLRDRVDGPAHRGRVEHLIGSAVRHPVHGIADGPGVRVQPAVAFDESDAVCGSAMQPLITNDVLILADALRVLGQLCLQEFIRQHPAAGAPHITPALLPGMDGVGSQVGGVLAVRVDVAGEVNLRAVSRAALVVRDPIDAAVHAARDAPVDLRDVLPVIAGDLPAQLCGQVCIGGLQGTGQRHGVGLRFGDGIAVLIQHGVAVFIQHRHLLCPFLCGIKALHEAVGRPLVRCVFSKAEGIKNSLDPGRVKASVFHDGVDGGDRRIQHREGGAHLRDVGLVLCGHLLREVPAVEAGVHGEVVVRGAAGAQRAENGDEQDEGREDSCDDPAHRLSPFLIAEHGGSRLCNDGGGGHSVISMVGPIWPCPCSPMLCQSSSS